MSYSDFVELLDFVGKDPSRLVFEDELTGIYNRRFLFSYLQHKVEWDGGAGHPLSLLMIDLDEFKEINDNHGHDTGDQVLTWLAGLLKEVGAERGLPIRYGGDEFILLLPTTAAAEARSHAEQLLQRTSERPFRLRQANVGVPITLSIGFATSPDHAATARDLFQAADTALFHAKQAGRNQACSAAEVDPSRVFPKTALYRLRAPGIVGRTEVLGEISSSLEAVARGKSRFLILEAEPGLGKTAVLTAVGRSLQNDVAFCTVRLAADVKETFRPYYVAARIVMELLRQRDGERPRLLEALTKEELEHLGYVLPQLATAPNEGSAPSGKVRKQIFNTLVRLLPRLAEYRPLVLLIDDVQFADEASLLLLRVLIRKGRAPIFVCAAAEPLRMLDGEPDASTLERFCSRALSDLNLRRLTLQPFDETAIGDYLKSVFPRLRAPRGFEQTLRRITRGNPLFLTTLIHHLVNAGKVNLIDQEWVIEQLEDADLPASLEEMLISNLEGLDETDRRLIQRASTLGEDVPVSLLAGSSKLSEHSLHESLEHAQSLGLLSVEFERNDEIVHFRGKPVLNTSYATIDIPGRRKLHKEIGNYAEELYRQHLLPSVSPLAFHFTRSNDREKARRYEQLRLDASQAIFDPGEAREYDAEIGDDIIARERRLSPESIARVPRVLRAFVSAARSIQLYPPESQSIAEGLSDVLAEIEEILSEDDELHLSHGQRLLLANGVRLDVSRYQALAKAFLALLLGAELQGIIFRRGVTQSEIRSLLTTLGKLKSDSLHPGFWADFSQEKRLDHLELQQVRYSQLRRRKTTVKLPPNFLDLPLGPEELALFPAFVRCLLGSIQKARLYPIDSQPVARSLEELQGSLRELIGNRLALTLANADRSLLVNGAKIDTSGFSALAGNLIEIMRMAGLSSVTFLAEVPEEEIRLFVAALRDNPAVGDSTVWDELSNANGLSSIVFNQRQYVPAVIESLLDTTQVDIVDEAVDEDDVRVTGESALVGPLAALRDSLPIFGKQLLLKGEDRLAKRLLNRLFENFAEQNPVDRKATLDACRRLSDDLVLGLQHKLSQMVADPLLNTLAEEADPKVLQALAPMLFSMANRALYFADYSLATRILLGLRGQREAMGGSDAAPANLARILSPKLDRAASQLLTDDLRSTEPDRRASAADVIGALGRPAIPLLIESIRQENDFRVRQMAAQLLAGSGAEAGKELKRSLATEVTVEQRFRILEVIDIVTQDLRHEITYCFGDASAKIRRAAFRLFERLQNDALIDVILPLAYSSEAAMAKGAIKSLTKIRSPATVGALVSVLERTADPKVAIACCQALGALGHASAINVLTNVLAQRRLPFFQRRWDEQVRATAAIALNQIADPRASAALARFAHDRQARVRLLATSPAIKR